MKATEQYFPVVLFIMLYKVVLTFESVDEILRCDQSNESYGPVSSCSSFYYATLYKVISLAFNLQIKSYSVTIQMEASKQYAL